MRIEYDVKLDFKDVLIRPKRSVLKSRSEVSLEREVRFKHAEPNGPAFRLLPPIWIILAPFPWQRHTRNIRF